MKSTKEELKNMASKRRLIPLTKWPDYHEYPSIAGLRHLVFTMPPGFSEVIRRVNGRILIDEEAWFNFVDNQNEEAKHHEA